MKEVELNFPPLGCSADGMDGILGVHAVDIRGKTPRRIHGVGASVDDEVRRVKIDTHVFAPDLLDEAQKRGGDHLPRFKEKALTVF